MDEKTLKSVAAQLRQPHGEYAVKVGAKMNESNLNINLYTIDALELAASDKVLEIGMGNGFFVKSILAANDSIAYDGCDFSEIMIEEAHKINEKFVKSGQAAFHLTNAGNLPFQNSTFDKVFTINTIYFWDNPVLVFSEIKRVLKPGGRIIISIRPKSVMQHYPFSRYGFTLFSKEDLLDLLLENDFNVKFIIEKVEPEQEISGEKVPIESLIVCAIPCPGKKTAPGLHQA